MELLDQFRSSGTYPVFVIDGVRRDQGMVTLHDVIESVTGEFLPHDTEEAWAVQREDSSWLLDSLNPDRRAQGPPGHQDRAGREGGATTRCRAW